MTFTQAGYTLEGNRMKINCIDTWFSFHKYREIEGVIKTITIKRDNGASDSNTKSIKLQAPLLIRKE